MVNLEDTNTSSPSLYTQNYFTGGETDLLILWLLASSRVFHKYLQHSHSPPRPLPAPADGQENQHAKGNDVP